MGAPLQGAPLSDDMRLGAESWGVPFSDAPRQDGESSWKTQTLGLRARQTAEPQQESSSCDEFSMNVAPATASKKETTQEWQGCRRWAQLRGLAPELAEDSPNTIHCRSGTNQIRGSAQARPFCGDGGAHGGGDDGESRRRPEWQTPRLVAQRQRISSCEKI